MQPLDVLGIVLAPIQIILGQIEQKLSKKAKNTKLAITLNCTSGMNSFLETNDNFCMQKQWQVQKKKKNYLIYRKLKYLILQLLIFIKWPISCICWPFLSRMALLFVFKNSSCFQNNVAIFFLCICPQNMVIQRFLKTFFLSKIYVLCRYLGGMSISWTISVLI